MSWADRRAERAVVRQRVAVAWCNVIDRWRDWVEAPTFDELCIENALRVKYSPRANIMFQGGRPTAAGPEVRAALAAANWAGYVTFVAQPGFEGTGFDGGWWRQRATVGGLARRPVAEGLIARATAAGLAVIVHANRLQAPPAGIPAAMRGDEVTATVGYRWARRDLRRVLGPARYPADVVQLFLIERTWGPTGRLWALLDDFAQEPTP